MEPQQLVYGTRSRLKWAALAFISLAFFLFIGLRVFAWFRDGVESGGVQSQQLDPKGSSLTDKLPEGVSGINIADSNLQVNARLVVGGGLVVKPSGLPVKATAGQIVYNDQINAFQYYDGTKFVDFAGVSSLGGIGGAINLGNGLVLSNNVLSVTPSLSTASGVSSLQGQTGAVVLGAGNGIVLTGTTIANAGVTGVNGTANQVAVSSSTGNVTLSLPQSIGLASSPTFAGLSLTSDLTLAAGSTLFGNTFLQTGAGQDVNINATGDDIIFTAGGRTFQFPTSGPGAQTICTTGITCVAGGGQAVLLAPGAAQTDSTADVSIFINDTGGGNLLQLQSGAVDRFSVANNGDTTIAGALGVTGTATLSGDFAANGTVLTLGNAVTDGLTIGAALQGTNALIFDGSTDNTNEITLAITDPGADFTLTLPAETGTICTTAGSVACTGVYGGSGGAPSGASYLTLGNDATLSAERVLTNGTNISFGDTGANGTLTINTIANPSFATSVTTPLLSSAGALTLTPGGLMTIGATTQTFTLQGGASSTITATNGANTTTLSFTAPTGARSIVLPNASGTVAVSASGNIALDAAGNITFTGTLPVASGGTNSGTAGGARTNLGAAASGANADITSTTALNTITPSASLTIGSSGQSLSLAGSGSTTLAATDSGNTTTIGFVTPTANTTLNFPALSAGTYQLCTTSGNCLGGGGGANTALSNLSSVAINTSLLTGASTIDLGSNAAPFRDLYIGGTATNNFRFTGSASAARTITIPDATGTICLSSGNCAGVGGTGDILNNGQNGTVRVGSNDANSIILESNNTDRLTITSGGNATLTSGTTGDALTVNNSTSIGNILVLQDNGTPVLTVADGGSITATGTLNLTGAGTALSVTNDASVGGALGVTGTTTLSGDLAANGTNLTLGNAASDLLTINATIQGASPLVFEGGSADANELTLAIASLTGDQTITIPDETGTICTTAGSVACTGVYGGSGGAPSGASYLTLGNDATLSAERVLTNGTNISFGDTGANGTLTINTIANPSFATSVTTPLLTSAAGLNVTGGTTLTLASTGAGNDVIINGADILDVQDNATFAGTLDVTSTTTLSGDFAANGTVLTLGNAVTDGLTIGAALQGTNALFFDGSSNDTNEITLAVTNPGADFTITLPAETGTICTTGSVCSGYQAAGSYANTTLSNLSSVAINTSLLPASSNSIDAGSAGFQFRSGYFATSVLSPLLLTADGAGASTGITLRSGNTTGGSGLSTGSVTIQSGDGSGTNTSSGNVSIDSGAKTGSGTNGTVSIGTTNASGVTIGRSGITTTVQGSGSFTGAGTALSVTNDANIGGALGVTGTATLSGNLAANGTVLTIGDAVTDGLTVNAAIQGSSALIFDGLTNDTNEITLAITDPGADFTITLPAATGTICLTSGNCAGVGGTGDILNNGQNGIVRVGSNDANSIILESNNTDRLTITSGGNATLTGGTTGDALTVNNSTSTGNILVLQDNGTPVLTVADGGGVTASNNITIQGGTATLGTTSQIASLVLHDGNGQTATIQVNDLAANRALTIPVATGSDTFCLQTLANCTGGSGVTTVGVIDSQAKSANGAVISGTNIYMQTADASNPGLVSTGTQTFAGAKTFSNAVILNGDLTIGDAVTDGLTVNAAIQGSSALIFDGLTNDTNEITLAITDPGADFTITLPAATGTICLTSGNCAGVGGTGDILNNGQNGIVRVGSNDANSIILESNNTDRLTITSAGNATLTGGTTGVALTVSNSTSTGNILTLNDNSTAVMTVADGGAATFQNTSNSTSAFRVINSAGTNTVLNVDTTNGRVGIAGATTASADLTFGNGANRVINVYGSTSGDGNSLTIEGGSSLANQTGGAVVLKGGNLFGATFSAAGSYSTINDDTGGNAVITGGNSGGQITAYGAFYDAMTGLTNGGSIFLNATAGAVGGTNGTVLVRNNGNDVSSFAVQNNSSNNVLTVDTSNNEVELGKASTLTGRLVIYGSGGANTLTIVGQNTPGGNRTLTLPDETGTFCTTGSVCSGYAPSSGSTNYIQNQSGSDQSADFRISGTGRANTAIRTPLLDTASVTGLSIGTGNANAITIGNSANNSGITIDSGTGTIAIGSGSQNRTVNIANGAAVQTVTLGSTNGASVTTVTAGTGGLNLGNAGVANTIQIGNTTGAVTQTINIGTNATASSVTNTTIGSTIGASTLALQAGTGNVSIAVQNSQASAFVVKQSTTNYLSADTSNVRVQIGASGTDATAILLVLDSYNTTDPTGVSGAMYYSTYYNRFRCYEAGRWTNCTSTDPSDGIYIRDDFMTFANCDGCIGEQNWNTVSSGTGAQINSVAATLTERPGIMALETGTTAAGATAMSIGATDSYLVGGGEVIEFAMEIPTLSNGTQTFAVRAGLGDNNGGEFTDGVYFEYDSTQSANWRTSTASNSSRTETSSSTAVATGWHRFKIVINSGATSIEYFVDGTSIGTVTTNIPTGAGRLAAPMFNIVKSLGSTSRFINVDYYYLYRPLTTPR